MRIAARLSLLSVLLTTPAWASVPLILSHQGLLADQTGAPLTGTYSMTFALYKVPDGGTALWTESQSVVVTSGLFHVYLGDSTALNPATFDGQLLYLGVAVAPDGEMQPRLRLGTVPYAFATESMAAAPNIWYRDGDGDTYGDEHVVVLAIKPPAGYVPPSLPDCDDTNPAIHPLAPDPCGDGIDSDCSLTDGSPEFCENGIDDDCNGIIDCPPSTNPCVSVVCINGTICSYPPLPQGVPCPTGTCDGAGNCVP